MASDPLATAGGVRTSAMLASEHLSGMRVCSFRADCCNDSTSYLVKISSVATPSPKVVLLEGSMRAAALRAVSAKAHAFDGNVGIHTIKARCCCRPRHQGQGAGVPPGSCGRCESREMFAGARGGLAQVQADVLPHHEITVLAIHPCRHGAT